MTYEEAASVYGVKYYQTSEAQTYQVVANALWKSSEGKYVKCLFSLNQRTDWDNLPADVSLRYLPASIIEKVDEI